MSSLGFSLREYGLEFTCMKSSVNSVSSVKPLSSFYRQDAKTHSVPSFIKRKGNTEYTEKGTEDTEKQKDTDVRC